MGLRGDVRITILAKAPLIAIRWREWRNCQSAPGTPPHSPIDINNDKLSN